MKVAISIWNDRISPVFDTAGELLLVHYAGTHQGVEERLSLDDSLPWQRIELIRSLGVNTLICGAVSLEFAQMLAMTGVTLIPFVAGDVHEVLQAFLAGDLPSPAFAMPGCCTTGRQRFGCCGPQKGDEIMFGGRGGGMGRGGGGQSGGRGQGRKRGMDRMGGPVTGGATGFCVCPKCKEQVEHQRGIPCTEMICPKCGSALVRQ